jgi:hypothetical protein
MEEEPTVAIVHRDRRDFDAPPGLLRLDEQVLAGQRPAFASQARVRAAAVAHKVATLVVTAKYFPAVLSDRFVGGDPSQLFRRPIPRDDGEVGVKGEERVTRSKRPGRSVSHGASFAPFRNDAHPQTP